MRAEFTSVWNTLGDILGALPADIVTVLCVVFIGICIVGILKAF